MSMQFKTLKTAVEVAQALERGEVVEANFGISRVMWGQVDPDCWHWAKEIEFRVKAVAEEQPRINDVETREQDFDRRLSDVIAERDHAQKMADSLAELIAKQNNLDIGEHSNHNCPWTNALNLESQEAP